MQNSSIVTRCPQCQTAFRVSQAQLNVAKGAVRCGSCLSIFRAMDHLDGKDKTSATTTTETQTTKTPSTKTHTAALAAKQAKAAVAPKAVAPKKTKPVQEAPPKTENTFQLDIDEELVQDNDAIDKEVDQESDDFYFYDKETEPANKNTSIFGNTTTKPVTEATQEKADESWALDILAELEEDDEDEPLSLKLPNRKEKPADDSVSGNPEKKVDLTLDNAPNTDNIVPLHRKENLEPLDKHLADDALDISAANDTFENTIDYEELIDEEFLEQPLSEPKQHSSNTDEEIDDLEFYYDESFESDTNTTSKANDFAEPLHEDFEEDLESLISDEQIDDAMDATPSYKQELQGMIKGIQSAPVEMSEFENEGRRKWLWRIALLLVALLLISQVAYFRFDSLSKHPTYRPILAQVCNVVGCQMPELVAIDQIRSNNLIVRSHPTAANALLVDVILINNANFEQPYPALSLEFSALSDALLAASEIQPEQYLRGELAGSRLMPIRQPIQVSLSIEDPGSDAVNYRLNILNALP